MIYTTSVTKESRAISAESVKEQLVGQLVFNRKEKAVVDVIKQLIKDIDELPTLDTINGKNMRKAYYPHIMVVDNCSKDAKPFQIGDNTHHQLEVRRGENSSRLSFVNLQCMVGTGYAYEGYTFVGKKLYSKMGDDTEIVPFDEVWVEDKAILAAPTVKNVCSNELEELTKLRKDYERARQTICELCHQIQIAF